MTTPPTRPPGPADQTLLAGDPAATVVAGGSTVSLAPSSEATRPTVLSVDGPPLPPATGTHKGQQWGDFRIGELLGKGGMGAVYRGVQVSLDRPVAIKVLPAHLSGDEAFRERFVIEARSVARISSPHVIQVYGAGVHEGHHFFAMELVDGQDLSRVLKTQGKPDHATAASWVLQAARGLAAAGDLGIIHRDIKPANLMLTTKGVLKIMDFGLARLASEGQGLTMTGTIMGTVSYFSPEQGRGERCDCRTDLYALGVTFFELLTGRLPFTGTEPTSIIYQHIHVAPPAPRTLDSAIPEDYQAVCLKCLQKSAEDRYQTAADLVRDLEALIGRRAPTLPAAELSALRRGHPVPRGPQGGSSGRPWGFISLVGLVAAGGVAAVAYALRPEEPAPATPPPAATATPIPAAATPTPVTVPPATAAVPATADPVPAPRPPAAPQGAGSQAAIHVFDPAPLQALLDANRFDDAREALKRVPASDPTAAPWGGLIDRAEAAHLVGVARQALAEGDLESAQAACARAGVLLPTATEPQALAADLAARRALVENALREAHVALDRQAPADAEEALARALEAVPRHAPAAALMAKARAERKRLEDLARQAQALVVEGDAALARREAEAALTAFTAALGLVPDLPAAVTGRAQAVTLQRDIAAAVTRFEEAVARRDGPTARERAADLQRIAPDGPAARSAAEQTQRLLAALEAERLAAEALERRRQATAADLARRLQDRHVPVEELARDLDAFLAEAGQDRPERAGLHEALEDRRQWAAVEARIAALDHAILAADATTIATIVEDRDLAAALTALGQWKGLNLTSTIPEFRRTGDRAVGRWALRHAMAVYPERTLIYAVDLIRRPQGWVVTAARRQDTP